MGHLLYLMFRCDFDVMENLESLEKFRDLNTPMDVLTVSASHPVFLLTPDSPWWSPLFFFFLKAETIDHRNSTPSQSINSSTPPPSTASLFTSDPATELLPPPAATLPCLAAHSPPHFHPSFVLLLVTGAATGRASRPAAGASFDLAAEDLSITLPKER